MKKIISFLLALLMAAGMSGCGGLTAEKNTAPPQITAQAEESVETPDAETASPAENITETVALSPETVKTEEIASPHICIGTNVETRYDEAIGVSLVSAYSPLLYCGTYNSDYSGVNDDPNYPSLVKALRALSDELAETCKKDADEYEESARMDVLSMGPESVAGRYFSKTEAWPVRADNVVTSIQSICESYAGGAHPYAGHTGYNFYSVTGERLFLSDVLTEDGMHRFPSAFETELYKQYPYFKDALLVEDLQSAIADEIKDGSISFTVGHEALTVLISPYEIAAYAAGPAFVRLSYSDFPDMFDSEFTSAEVNSISALMPQNEDIYGFEIHEKFTAADGQERSLSIMFMPYLFDEGISPSLSVKLDGYEWSPNDFYAGAITPYVFRISGKVYLYIEYASENDWRGIYILDLNGTNPVLMQNSAEAFYSNIPTDPVCFALSTRTNIMSTYNISRRYSAAAGVPVPIDYLYSVSFSPSLTLKQDMVMTVLQSSTGDSGTAGTISAGTKFSIYRTDNVSLVDLLASDGRICRVSFERGDDYLGTVNGKALTDVFDGVVFAG